MTAESAVDLDSILHNETPRNGYQWKVGHTVTKTRVLTQDILNNVIPRPSSRVLTELLTTLCSSTAVS